MSENHPTAAESPPPTPDLTAAWRELIEALPANQRAWLTASAPVTVHGTTVIVAAKDEFTRGQLETRLRSRLEACLSRALDREVRLAVTVDPELDDVEDALGEVVNVVAGSLKGAVGGTSSLGLPSVTEGSTPEFAADAVHLTVSWHDDPVLISILPAR